MFTVLKNRRKQGVSGIAIDFDAEEKRILRDIQEAGIVENKPRDR